jgi:glucose-6-phosphate isomerase
MEGPFDKTITFLVVRDPGDDVPIPNAYPDVPSLSYLGGATLAGLLDAERVATTAALTRRGRMNMTLEVPAVNAHTLGQLLMFFQIATVYAGGFYDVDPLDQPGVELGKELTYGLMGREGFEAPPASPADPAYSCE